VSNNSTKSNPSPQLPIPISISTSTPTPTPPPAATESATKPLKSALKKTNYVPEVSPPPPPPPMDSADLTDESQLAKSSTFDDSFCSVPKGSIRPGMSQFESAQFQNSLDYHTPFMRCEGKTLLVTKVK